MAEKSGSQRELRKDGVIDVKEGELNSKLPWSRHKSGGG
jgi:hypothetical protein